MEISGIMEYKQTIQGLMDEDNRCNSSDHGQSRPIQPSANSVINFDSCISESPAHNQVNTCSNTNNALNSTTAQDLVIETIEKLNIAGQENQPNLEKLSRLNSYDDNKKEDISVIVSNDKLVTHGHRSTHGHSENSDGCEKNGEGNNSANTNIVSAQNDCNYTDSVECIPIVNNSAGLCKRNALGPNIETDISCENSCPETMTTKEVKVTFYGTDDNNEENSVDEVAAKTRKLNSDEEIQEQKSSNVLGLFKLKVPNHNNSGSDLESLGDSGEEGLIVGESQEPCDCDECLLEGPVEKKPAASGPMKKVISKVVF